MDMPTTPEAGLWSRSAAGQSLHMQVHAAT